MSYEPTNWKTGDVVTSAKLNKLENGVAGAPDIFVVTLTGDGELPVADKTFQEVVSAINEGSIVLMKSGSSFYQISGIDVGVNDEVETIVFIGPPIYNGEKLEIIQIQFQTKDGTDEFLVGRMYINVEPT